MAFACLSFLSIHAFWRRVKSRLTVLLFSVISATGADSATPSQKHLFDTPVVSLRGSRASHATFNFQSSLSLNLGESERAERDAQQWRALNGADLISKVPRRAPATGEKILNYFSTVNGSFLSANPNRPPGNFTK